MKIVDIIFPVLKLDPNCVTDQIKQTYNDFSGKAVSTDKKLKTLLGGCLIEGFFAGFSWAILRAIRMSSIYVLIYMAPFIAIILIFCILLFGNTTNTNWAIGVIAVPPLMFLSCLGGNLFLFGAVQMQSNLYVAIYYSILFLYISFTIAMYRADYKKFPEIAYKNSKTKKSKLYPILLLGHSVGYFAARNIPYGVLGISMFIFVVYLCHFESFLLIIVRYQPQVIEIGRSRGYR